MIQWEIFSTQKQREIDYLFELELLPDISTADSGQER